MTVKLFGYQGHLCLIITYCNEAILLNFIKVTLEFCYKFSQMNKILKTAWIKA